MNTDRTAYAVGIGALCLAGLALWRNYGSLDWRVLGIVIPIVLIVIGAGMLALSRKPH